MHQSMLRCIYYITNDSFVNIPPRLTDDLAAHGIRFYQVPFVSIDRFLPPKNMPLKCCLILCDIPELINALQENGYFCVAVLNQNNKGKSFDNVLFAVEEFEEIEWIYYIRFWQRMMGLPWHILDTKRCKIREMVPGDLDAMYDMYDDKRIVRYTEDLFARREDELQYIRDYIRCIYSYYGFGTWLIEDLFSHALIGRAGFNYRPGFDDPELGFVVNPIYWRHGYAYEVCSALMEYGKNTLGFTQVQALSEPENTASIELLRKLGFSKDSECTLNNKLYEKYLFHF